MGKINKSQIILTLISPIIIIATPLNESFSGTTFPPTGWRVINNDGGLYSWERYTASPRTTPACVSSRYENISLRNDDWLITCKLVCRPNTFDTLKFWYRKISPGTRETLEIRLSTTGNNINNFTTLLWATGFTTTSYLQKVIPLDDFDNEEVYIAFVNKGLYQGRINLDDITGPEMVAVIDVGVDSIINPGSSFMLRPLGIGFQPQAIIINCGNTILRNIPVVCSIIGQGSILRYQNTQYLDSILSDSSKTITFVTFVPTVSELCTVRIRTLLASDTNLTNNMRARTTQIIRGQYTGGPDSGYFYWIDSDTTGGPIYNWNDISLTGTPLPAGGSNFSYPTPIDFNFNYYGELKTYFCYSTKGFISFDTLWYSYGTNTQFPNIDLPNNIIAPFWDDLYTIKARHQTFGSSPNRYKIIQWNAIVNSAALLDTVIFQLILHENGDIVFQYNRCDNQYNLGQGQTATVGIENSTGTTGLQYLYDGIPQGNLLSAGRAIRFYQSCHDVLPESILISPQVGLGDTILPKVVVRNAGTETESFSTVLKIESTEDLFYWDTIQIINLPPASICTVNFDQWISNQYGNYIATAWTTLANDFIRSNDTCSQNITVSVGTPVLLNPTNNLITNICNQIFDWTGVTLATRYNFIILNNIDTILYISHYGPRFFNEGNYQWQVRAGNQTSWGSFSQLFSFTIDTTRPLPPTLISPFQNCTLSTPHPQFIWQQVNDAVNYEILILTASDTIINQIISDTFYTPIQSLPNGACLWKVRCQDLATNWSNFSQARTFFVHYQMWQQKADIPELNSLKPVSAGGCLTSIGNKVYAFKGNNTQDFYEYDIFTDEWSLKCSVPFITRQDSVVIRRKVKGGAALVCADSFIFALKGNNTNEFWFYDRYNDIWQTKKSVPALKNIKDGSCLTYFNGYVYCLVGKSPSFEFYKYDIQNDTWITLRSAPEGRNHRRFRSGSCIVYGGNNIIYALKGGSSYNEFYSYDIIQNLWSELDSLPKFHPQIRKRYRTKTGASMVFNGNNTIYVIKGGGRNEFWKWDITTNRWLSADTIPRLNKRSVPKSGAALTYAANSVWLLKGNKTREFWAYGPYESQKSNVKSQNLQEWDERQNPLSNNCNTTQTNNYNFTGMQKIVYFKNSQRNTVINYKIIEPKVIKIRIYDLQGRLVKVLPKELFGARNHIQEISFKGLSSGIYFLVFDE